MRYLIETAASGVDMPLSDPDYAFSHIPVDPRRSLTKPRRAGLTMMNEYGLTGYRQADLLATCADFIDIAKVSTGSARMYKRERLIEKLAAYRDAEIKPYLGGQFQEYVLYTLGSEAFPKHIAEAAAVGFAIVEISDNVVPVSDAERQALIRLIADHGMEPVVEVGAKYGHLTRDEVIRQVAAGLAEGATLVMVEAAELMIDGTPNEELILALKNEVDTARVVFELGTPRIGMTMPDIYTAMKFMLKTFGPDVNLGNVPPEIIFETETLRLGLGSSGPTGGEIPKT